MASDGSMVIRDARGRDADARVIHEGGGLLTIAFEGEPLTRLKVGDLLRWSGGPASAATSLGGTIASIYTTGEAVHVVISPQGAAAPAARAAPAESAAAARAPAAAAAPTCPVAAIEVGDQVLIGQVRSMGTRGVTIYVRRAPEGLLAPHATVRLAIQLPRRATELHFVAVLERVEPLQHGVVGRFELQRTEGNFEEQRAMLARYFGHAGSASAGCAASASSTAARR